MFKKKRYIFVGNNNDRTIALYFDSKNKKLCRKIWKIIWKSWRSNPYWYGYHAGATSTIRNNFSF